MTLGGEDEEREWSESDESNKTEPTPGAGNDDEGREQRVTSDYEDDEYDDWEEEEPEEEEIRSRTRWGRKEAEQASPAEENMSDNGEGPTDRGERGAGIAADPDLRNEAGGKAVTDINTHEEIIKLIRAGASENEWEAMQEKERERIEESDLRWRTMKFVMNQDEHRAIENTPRESEIIDFVPAQEEERSAAKKRRIEEVDEPGVREYVLRRSQRVRKVTHKAKQPEFIKFMRHTTIGSETTRHEKDQPQRRKHTGPLSLMVRWEKKIPTQGDRELRQREEEERTRSGTKGNQYKCRELRHGEGISERMEMMEEHEDSSDGEPVREKSGAKGHRIARRRPSDETLREKEHETAMEIYNPKNTSPRQVRSQFPINIGTIGIRGITNPQSNTPFWSRGRLRPLISTCLRIGQQLMNPFSKPFVPRVIVPARHHAVDQPSPITPEKIYPPHGLVLPWSGVVLVGTSVTGMFKKVLRKDLIQTILTVAGATFVVEDPQTRAKTYHRGQVTITFDGHHKNPDEEVPIPEAKAVDAMWNRIFRPGDTPHPNDKAQTNHPLDNAKGKPSLNGRQVSIRKRARERNKVYLQARQEQIPAAPNPTGRIEKGTEDDPIDVDGWIGRIEEALARMPSSNHSPAHATSQRGQSGDAREYEERLRRCYQAALEVSNENNGVRIIRRRNLHDEQDDDDDDDDDDYDSIIDVESDYDGDGEESDTSVSISSTDSDFSEGDYEELMEILRTPEGANEFFRGPLKIADAEDIDMEEREEGEIDEIIDGGAIEEDEVESGPKMALYTQYIRPQPTDATASPAATETYEDTQKITTSTTEAAEAMLKAIADAPKTIELNKTLITPPPSPTEPYDLPPLESVEASVSSTGWENVEAQDPWMTKTAWDNSIYVTTGQLDEVERQMRELERKLKMYFPENSPHASPQLPLWTTPYTLWTSHADLESQVHFLNGRIDEERKKTEAHAAAFEGYQGEMSEQLDRRFKGLRDAQTMKVQSTEAWVARIEERMARRELQEMMDDEKAKECRQHLAKVQKALDEERKNAREFREAVDYNLTTLRLQLAILGEIAGLPTFITLPAAQPTMNAARRGSQPPSDPRDARREGREREGDERPESYNDSRGQDEVITAP